MIITFLNKHESESNFIERKKISFVKFCMLRFKQIKNDIIFNFRFNSFV